MSLHRRLFVMRKLVALSLSLASLATASPALTIGDKAPPMKVAAFVKGKGVDLSKGVHVVEFWATWCPPCRDSIPHLTEMAKKYKGKVSFTGISVYERGFDQLGQVRKFVGSMGDKMAYNVAWDGQAMSMSKTWLEAARQNGIPSAFLVKNGRILWIGHPAGGLDEAMDQVLAGKFDLAAAKAAFDKQATSQNDLQSAIDLAMARKWDEALVALDNVTGTDPSTRSFVQAIRFGVLVSKGSPRQKEEARKIVEGDIGQDVGMLRALAEMIVAPQEEIPAPDYEAAVILAKAAAEKSEMKDPSLLELYATSLAKNGRKAEAIDIQKKAIALARADSKLDKDTLGRMEARLEEFKKAP